MSWSQPIDLQDLPLFRGVPVAQIASLQQFSRCKNFATGTCLLTETRMGEVIYFLLKGSVKFCIEHANGKDFILNMYGPGALLGYIDAIDGMGQHISVHTMEPSTIMWMDRAAFVDCAQQSPAFAFNLVAYNLSQTRILSVKMHAMAAYDVNGRVARQLLLFAQEYGRPCENGATLIPFRLTQNDLADMVGASRASVNKVIGGLRGSRAISLDSKHQIRIHCVETLRQHCR